MQTKLQLTQEILQKQIEGLWKSTDEYRSFLKTSSRLYKYSFKDQALIHAQRPDAVACAEFDNSAESFGGCGKGFEGIQRTTQQSLRDRTGILPPLRCIYAGRSVSGDS